MSEFWPIITDKNSNRLLNVLYLLVWDINKKHVICNIITYVVNIKPDMTYT